MMMTVQRKIEGLRSWYRELKAAHGFYLSKLGVVDQEVLDQEVIWINDLNTVYQMAMDKVDELEKEGKFREAWMKVPDLTEFPEKADEIRKRKTSLSDKFATPSLFGTTEETAPEQPQVAEVTADYPIDEADEEE